MVPPAPGGFSTISGWPLANCAKPFDRLRDKVSAAPPAPTVTNNRTGRAGHCAADSAEAVIGAKPATEQATIAMTCVMLWRMSLLVNGMLFHPGAQKPIALFVSAGASRHDRYAHLLRSQMLTIINRHAGARTPKFPQSPLTGSSRRS